MQARPSPRHSMTSSVRASSVIGGSNPSALAVLRLITSWNLVACWTGSSAGFLALEHTIHVGRCPPIEVDIVDPVGRQAPAHHPVAEGVDRGQPVLLRQRDDPLTASRGTAAGQHDQPAVRPSRQGFDRSLDLGGAAHARAGQFNAERRQGRLDCRQMANRRRIVGIIDDGDTLHARRNLLEQLQPLHRKPKLVLGEAGDVAAGPGQAGDKAKPNRVGDLRKHDRNVARCPLQRRQGGGRAGNDHIRPQLHQFCRIARSRSPSPPAQR